LKSPTHKSNPTSGLAGGGKAAPDASQLLAPSSPNGARFFIRHDGQYLVTQKFVDDDQWRYHGKMVMITQTEKIKTAVLGFTPDYEGTILQMEEFFFN